MRTTKEYYTGIDAFRLIAALLVVAIHTSPLGKINDTGNFILTRVAARTAVPFFFMASGFFVLSRYDYKGERLKKFVKKTALLYGGSIILYLPVNVRNGYFRQDNFVLNFMGDILFDGTIYHLWYLPAAMMGSMLALWFIRRFDYKGAFFLSGFLYLVGLFGDSWYGVTGKFLEIYHWIFQVCSYTRNGIFFAPIFFVLGGFLAEQRRQAVGKKCLLAFVVCFIFMLLEALTLHGLNVQRHDSMYLFLVPCMYFLFRYLMGIRGKKLVWARDASLTIYIIHPMIIAILSTISGLSEHLAFLSEDFLVNFVAVCTLSVLSGVVASVFAGKYRRERSIKGMDRAYISISRSRLEHNVNVLRNAMGQECELMAVVKAEAYGHGGYEISTCLDRMGVRAYAAATIDEGIRLRKYGVRGEILILGYTVVERAKELKRYHLTQTLVSPEYTDALNGQGMHVKTHIKIDTGMHRLGYDMAAVDAVKEVFHMKYIRVDGIFTHLCCADSVRKEDVDFTYGQINGFYGLINELKMSGIHVPKIHIQSSYGFFNYPELKCDYVRAGVALYGVKSLPEDSMKRKLDLLPVLSLKSRIILIRKLKTGECAGYGRDFVANRDSVLAIVPVGYGDGIPRSLSNHVGSVLINGQTAPIVGRVCMDSLMVDITHVNDVSIGDTVTLISNGTDPLYAANVAEKTGSISNELLCRLGARLPVIVC
ncbi:MAG: serine racemase VanT catalytic subunit [Clostridium sp.]|nr:serine racemase VanT catalytic subunit [Clostridium sp.]MCM1398699.1 serine racemase VanT catalytic subunit [Clostridium sp.]MCM1458670.1 serine racemase VanT catalytic subunit [Bacteroides sp.]